MVAELGYGAGSQGASGIGMRKVLRSMKGGGTELGPGNIMTITQISNLTGGGR